MPLSSSQKAALQHVEEYARTLDSLRQGELLNVLAMSNVSRQYYDYTKQQICEHARVGIQFHPDRPAVDGRSVAESLLEDGLYKNQFDTGISNGKVDPRVKGSRVQWEDRIFGGAYCDSEVALSERPKYGALNLIPDNAGPCPRFGSSYLLLKPAVTQRCTFTYMDSHRDPPERGTSRVFEPLMRALLIECFERRFALGRKDISPSVLLATIAKTFENPSVEPSKRAVQRNLNHYIEAQIHGDVCLQNDVDALVADSSFKGTTIEKSLQGISERYGVELYWYGGFRIAAAEIPDDFRGPAMPSLGKRIATHGYVDARCIGEAARALKNNPADWADRGSYEDVLQELKCMWHVLVQFG